LIRLLPRSARRFLQPLYQWKQPTKYKTRHITWCSNNLSLHRVSFLHPTVLLWNHETSSTYYIRVNMFKKNYWTSSQVR
jgi:hypothetical protein